MNNVVGIQILNEPNNVDSLPAFYSTVLAALRRVSPEAAAFPFYIHDGFDLSRFADYISTRSDFVVLDHHSYFVFGDTASRKVPASELASQLTPGQGSVSQQIIAAATEERRNIVIDEFSCALSAEALSNSNDPIGDRRKFCTGQMESYTNSTAGWSFWSYKTEGCPGDENWCFTSAVGKSLPSTFFSYPNATIASFQSTGGDTPSAPSDPSFLSFGTSMPDEAAYSPPTTEDWLEAVGKDSTNYNTITEALATTEYDVDLSGSFPVKDELSTTKPAQAPYIAINTNTVPSLKQRSLLETLPQRAFLLASDSSKHRFLARHRRHALRKNRPSRRQDDTPPPPSPSGTQDYTPEQAAISKGYADGWRAAKTFANFGKSRLGFTGQFMADALAAMGSQIVSGDEGHYKTWFMKGLADGEMQVIKMMALESQGPM